MERSGEFSILAASSRLLRPFPKKLPRQDEQTPNARLSKQKQARESTVTGLYYRKNHIQIYGHYAEITAAMRIEVVFCIDLPSAVFCIYRCFTQYPFSCVSQFTQPYGGKAKVTGENQEN
ncbi:hypothetical protein GQX74_013721 [Glossina fuscipes]|nr:hypothetical protein GQX74_013721 [Glossina fuscipes]